MQPHPGREGFTYKLSANASASLDPADIINHHTLGITGGKTYAELPQDDPNRTTAMQSAFLQASLFTSVVAFGVCAMAFVLGIVLTMIGFALRAPGH